MKKRILALTLGVWFCFAFNACGYNIDRVRGRTERVLASQSVTTTSSFGALIILNGYNDTLPGLAPLSGGNFPGLMASSPTRDVIGAFDSSTNSLYAVNTATEKNIGSGVRILGPTTSFIIPTALPIAYAAVPSAVVTGFAIHGAINVVNFATQAVTTIAAPNAQTVVSNANATQLLVFSNDSNSMIVLSPGVAAPPVDTSCYSNPPNAVCTFVPGFDRPAYAIVAGNTAYVLNCGPECGGTQASVMTVDLTTLTITNTIPVDAATWGFLSGSTLYVAGTSPTNNACTGENTAAQTCGRLDVVDLGSGTVTASAVITDGYHDRMDLTQNGQVFVGSFNCTNVGDIGNPGAGEVRGCLSIYHVDTGAVIIPPDNGNVDGLQGFISRNIEYVAEGGNLRVYDTEIDSLLINMYVPLGTFGIPGYVGDVKAMDFF
ncbi:MAG: hypothetical protein WAM79_06680 [Candidatus Sulfotelmatobacter sp.]